MSNGRNLEPAPTGFSLVDIYFVLFRRKWLIIIFTVLGILAGGAYYMLRPPPYQSSAKLFIKYIADMTPNSATDPGQRVINMQDRVDSALNSEMQILTSFDIYEQVATNIGPEIILAKAGGGSDPFSAASLISKSVKVEPSRDSSVIQITYKSFDPTIVSRVVESVITAYLEKHKSTHSSGIPEEVLVEKLSAMRAQLANTEEELHMAKTNAGIMDIVATEKAYSDQTAEIRRELFKARADWDQYQASAGDLSATKKAPTNSAASSKSADQKIPEAEVSRYKAACSRLIFLQKRLDDYLLVMGYPEGNKLVKETQEQLAEATKAKGKLETDTPGLAELDFSSVSQEPALSSAPGSGSMIRSSSLPTRIRTLEQQLQQVQAEGSRMGDAEQKISELSRRKKMIESTVEKYETQMQRTRIDEELEPGLVSGINKLQKPSPPFRDFDAFHKKVYMIMFGGFAFGLALALLMEFYLDRTIKRPIEIQNKLKIPFFLSIPDLNQGARRASLAGPSRNLLGAGSGSVSSIGTAAVAVRDSSLEVMASAVNRRFDSYYDALRDRLVVYFESINLTRKPKLVAVTSTHKGAGVSTIAAGLASSLSETGDGRVLLVDMNMENGSAQQFFRGQPNCKLDDALESETRDGARVQENLYVVNEDTFTDKLPRALPKRFASLIPKLKASDYDYIIFDMPPVSPTSVTARLSGFMDTVMLVIESEKTDQQVVQQANALLLQSKANVTAVLNKTKTYIPKQLHQDFLSEV